MTDTAASRDRFDFGRVFGHAFGSIRRNAATFAALALLLAGAPALISTIGLISLVSQFGQLLNGGPLANVAFPHISGVTGLLVFAGGLVGIVTNAMLQAAVIYGTASYLNGREAGFGECLGAGARRCLPLIGLNIVAVIAIGFGCLLFLFPGVMMAVAWIAATPALVVERTGVFGAFSRSADLTRGRRWPIFGLALLYLIAVSVVQQVLINLMGVAFGAATPQAMMLNQLPVSAVVGVVVSVITSAGVAAIYYELRSTREGIGPEALAAVFD
jgi:hypothetical protein